MLDIKEIIGIVTVILSVTGYALYIRDTIRGTTKPHVYTWFVWALTAFIIYALQISGGAGAGAWATLAVSILVSTIFLLGLRHGSKNITRSDTLFFLAAFVALGLWLIVDQPLVSIILLVTTGILGFVPTLRKAWHEPDTETLSAYVIAGVRHSLSVFALAEYNLLTWLFPVAWSIANFLFVAIVFMRRK